MAVRGGGGGGSAAGVKAGQAFVSLFLDDSRLSRGLSRAASRVKNFGAGIGGVGLSVLGPAVAAVGEMINHFSNIQDAADRLSTTPEIISALGYAADQSGASIEDVEAATKKLYKTISDEGRQAMPLDEEFKRLADELEAIEDPAARSARALEVMGKSGLKLMPMLKGGSGGLSALLKDAKDVGDVISSEDAARAERAGDAITKVWKSIKNTVREAAAAALPFIDSIEAASNQFVGAGGSAREFIRNNAAIIVGVVAAAAGLVALGTAVTAAGFAISGVSAIIGVVTGVVSFLLTPVGLLTVGVLALVAALVYFSDFGKTFGETWGGITNALKSGDLALAAKIGLLGLEVEWVRFTNWIMDKWLKVANFIEDTWHKLWAAVAQGMVDGLALLRRELPDHIFRRVFGDKAAEANLDEVKRSLRLDAQFEQMKRDRQRREDAEKRGENLADLEQKQLGLLGEAALKALFAEIHGDIRKDAALPPGLGAVGDVARGSFNTMGFGSQAFASQELALGKRQARAAEEAVEELAALNDKFDKLGPVVYAT